MSRRVLNRASWGAAACLLAACIGQPRVLSAGDDFSEFPDSPPATDDLADDIVQELGAGWWNDDWTYRQKLEIDGPGLLALPEGTLFIREPDPLLLFNTGRCARGFADLRVVDREGKLLPCGVLHFGRDDGTSYLWCVPNEPTQSPLSLFVYYGNRDAKSTKDVLPTGARPPKDVDLQVVAQREERRQDAEPSETTPVGQFFDAIRVVEAEAFKVVSPAGVDAQSLVERADQASGGGLLAMDAAHKGSQPVQATSTLDVPRGGKWRLHVRYRHRASAQKNVPFRLSVEGKEFACGESRETGARFGWQTIPLELTSGAVPLKLSLPTGAAVDCLLFTQNADYLPDYRDVSGPVWIRVKLLGEDNPSYLANMFCYHITYSVDGMQGNTTCYLLGDRAVPALTRTPTPGGPGALPAPLRETENLLTGDQWSPWGQALPRGSFTWFTKIFFVPGKGGAGAPMRDLKIAFQFATRPDESRAFRDGKEDSGPSDALHVHMPTELDLATLRRMTLSFGQWSRERFEMAESLGFKPGEGPRRIVTSTMANAYSREDAEYLLKTCDGLGLNMINMDTEYLTDEICREHHMTGFQDHPWTYYKFMDYYQGISQPAKGQTYEQAVDAVLTNKADAWFQEVAESRRKLAPWAFEHSAYNVLGDEIGPAISGSTINEQPLFKGFFHEFLAAQGLTPEFFGESEWSGVDAVDYYVAPDAETRRFAQQVGAEADAAVAQSLETNLADAGEETTEPDVLADATRDEQAMAAEARRAQQRLAQVDPAQATPAVKRAFHYTQVFRNYFTAMFYRRHVEAMRKHFPKGATGSVNFQAMPVQIGQMWDGGLDIFSLARQNGLPTLQVEDWCGYESNVSFGMALLRAAARQNHQDLAALIVGSQPQARIMANLMQGARYFHFYLYGPVYRIGPVWAEDKETQRQIGVALRQIARCEDDILAASHRPASAALLVANTTETCSAWFAYPFGRERLAVYAALSDAQIPLDIVGEQEILEDDALSRYRVLYVTDPHVDHRVQQRIKDWVHAGGTLWADYAGLARQEFDEPSTICDEVFGLTQRGEIEPFVAAGYGVAPIPSGPTVKIKKSKFLQPDEILGLATGPGEADRAGLLYQPRYQLSGAESLATFDDGSPALIQHRYGKGQAVLCGYLAGLSYSGYAGVWSQAPRGADSGPLRAQVITLAARQAKASPHVQTAASRLMTAVHDGPDQTVVYLLNAGEEKLTDEPIGLTLPWPPKVAYAGSSNPVDFTVDKKNRVRFKINLESTEGEIVVFKPR